ncbi:MAG: hypothetical protein IAC51_03435 [bacterium]|uniref:Ig-like domain-containing protein n=1 Tax=Candidatus Aphodosoma intestinipullorum TaxID=2840674 RepID=A0A940DJD3_9BACT|nr:hypothetical protein [Candidatus Aphodosoma intestinipullorum]
MKIYQDMKDGKKVKAINHSKLEYKMSPSDSYQSVNLNRYKYIAEVRRGKYVLVFTLSVLFLLLSVPAGAQNITLPYFNGWEDEVENAQWVMNSGINGSVAKNRWYVSTKERFGGEHSLLISDLSLTPDTSASYSNSTVNIVAARTFNLPAGTYDLSFAWKAYGEVESNTDGGYNNRDGMYVAWINANEDIATILAPSLPSWATTSHPYRGRFFSENTTWRVEQTTVTSQGVPMMLAFLWVNNDQNSMMGSACIDDIQISRNSCGKPDIESDVDMDNIKLTWDAEPGAVYEIKYSGTGGVSDTILNITGGTVTISGVTKGVYNIQSRVICNGDTSIWYLHDNVLVNDTEGLCIDYINLEGEGVTCYLSDEEENPFKTVGIDRYGIAGDPPRHCVNTDTMEYDPRTGGKLRVIPDGEFVSIRLGNWKLAQSEAIEYTMALDSGSNVVLVMKYAVVLEVPSGHSDDQMPKFHLEFVDEDGRVLDPMCGSIDFYASFDLLTEGWYQADLESYAAPIIYKDWTTIGISLADYAAAGDRTIKIRLSTNDCTQSGHFGYAYFTLGCTSGSLEGLTCGDFKTDEITAPEGFNYRWYKKYAPDEEIPGADQRTLKISDNDTTTYSCDCILKENPGCYFTLDAVLQPRFPKAKFEAVWSPEECKNAVRLNNLSYIETRAGVSPEMIEDFEWDFGDGRTSTERHPVVDMPDEGGTLHVTLRAGIVDWMCEDVWDTTITVPAVGDVWDTTFVTICEGGNPYIINGVAYKEAGDHVLQPVKSYAGCDSTHVVRISVVEQYETEMDTTICHGDTLTVGRSNFTFSGDFTTKLESSGGCDSVVHVKLTVLPEVTFSLTTENATDGPNSGRIMIADTLPGTWYTVNGEPNGRLDSLPVGEYTIVCYNELECESAPQTVEITTECAEVEFDSIGKVCGDDEAFYVPVEVTAGKVSHYNLRWGEKATAAGFAEVDSVTAENGYLKVMLPDSVRPDRYEAEVEVVDRTCGGKSVTLPFEVLYPSSVIRQKWNNVMALTNAEYNGGYEFTDFQWYRNGEAVNGENGSYLYLGEGEAFEAGDVYSAEVTRSDDGVRLMTCGIVAEARTDTFPYPQSTAAGVMSRVRVENVRGEVTVRLWDVSGVYCGEQLVEEGDPYFTTPARQGVYVLRIGEGETARVYKIVTR